VRARYEIVGEGALLEPLRARASELGVAGSVVFVGFERAPFARERGWDVYLHPSNDEGLSNAILEAMALERPIVATDVTGVREQIVDGESGLIVPPRDPAAIAAAVRRLREDPALAARLGANARARVVELFDLRRSAERYLAAYEELLARSSRRRSALR
jgi:glycosyltransferase involved in cell wall biosynthesis